MLGFKTGSLEHTSADCSMTNMDLNYGDCIADYKSLQTLLDYLNSPGRVNGSPPRRM